MGSGNVGGEDDVKRYYAFYKNLDSSGVGYEGT